VFPSEQTKQGRHAAELFPSRLLASGQRNAS